MPTKVDDKPTSFTAYLVKEDKESEVLSEAGQRAGRTPKNRLPAIVVHSPRVNAPKWWDGVIEPLGLADGITAPKLAIPGAVVLLRIKKRLMALVFGHGRLLLNTAALVSDFGLRVALNALTEDGLRSIDLRTLEASPLLTRRQRLDERALSSFGVDRIHELLKAVGGKLSTSSPSSGSSPSPSSYLRQTIVAGADGFHGVATGPDRKTLTGACEELLAHFNAGLPARYAWVDHLRLVRDAALQEKLALHLAALLHKKAKATTADVQIGPPRPLSGEELMRLRYNWKRDDSGALQLDALLDRIADADTDVEVLRRLKRDRVELLSLDLRSKVDSWSVFRCINTMTTFESHPYVLANGDWYQVDKTYRTAVQREFDAWVDDSLSISSDLKLPPWDPTLKKEEHYNDKVAKALSGSRVLMDKKNLHLGGYDKIELCDVVQPSAGYLIHSKIGRDSSTLSHLFNQGTVGLSTLLEEPRATQWLEKASADQGVSLDGPFGHEFLRAASLRVVFVVIDSASTAKTWRLPFFSMLAGTQAMRRIQERGGQAFIVRVR